MQKFAAILSVALLSAICEGSQSQIRLLTRTSSQYDGAVVNLNSSIGKGNETQRQVQEITSECFSSVKTTGEAEFDCAEASTLATTNGEQKTATA